MALFKKKIANVVDSSESKVTIGGRKVNYPELPPLPPLTLPPLEEPKKDETQTLYEAILGMSDLTYKVEAFALMLEINQRLITLEPKIDEILKKAKE